MKMIINNIINDELREKQSISKQQQNFIPHEIQFHYNLDSYIDLAEGDNNEDETEMNTMINTAITNGISVKCPCYLGLKYCYGYTTEEIASMKKKSVRTINNKMREDKEKLKKMLKS